jgi:hypothetical protein
MALQEPIKHYGVKGIHPESDSEWFERESFDTIEEVYEYYQSLPEIDHGLGHHELWDLFEMKQLEFEQYKHLMNKEL